MFENWNKFIVFKIVIYDLFLKYLPVILIFYFYSFLKSYLPS